MKAKLGRRSRRLIVALVILTIALHALPPGAAGTLRMWITLPVQPFQWGATRASVALAGLPLRLSRGDAPDVRRLEREVARLSTRVAQLEARIEAAQRRLENLARLERPGTREVAMANIIASDSSDWRRTLVVDRGAAAGVRVGDVAVWYGALAGRVTEVGPKCSRIRLLTDPAARVAVRSARTRVHGVLFGRGEGRCRLRYVGYDRDIAKEDVLVTAGTDGAFPPDYLVGRCLRSDARPGELERRIEVIPWIAPGRVEAVKLIRWRAPDRTFPERAAET